MAKHIHSQHAHASRADHAITALHATSELQSGAVQPPPARAILCVDSSGDMRDVLRDALPGYELVFASSGYEALRNINSRVFDLYVLEYWLPDWTGTSLCRDIRKVDPHVPVCFCTAAAQPENRKRAERAGATAYFVKPVHPELVNGEVSVLAQLAARRNEHARRAAASAIQQELERRRASVPDGMLAGDIEKALKRSGRAKARDAFVESGGTLASFERVWELLWEDAWEAVAQS